MGLFKRCKSKKVISIIVSTIMTVAMFTTTSHSMNKRNLDTVPKTKIERQVTTTKITSQTQKSHKVKYKLKVTATAYCGDTITSTGTVPVAGRTIAVDPRVIPYGTKVYIPEFNGVFIAEDCGSAIKGNKIDIFMNSYNQAMNWGRRTITIYVLEN